MKLNTVEWGYLGIFSCIFNLSRNTVGGGEERGISISKLETGFALHGVHFFSNKYFSDKF